MNKEHPVTVMKSGKCTATITDINFDKNKHPDIFNRRLAKIIVDRAKEEPA